MSIELKSIIANKAPGIVVHALGDSHMATGTVGLNWMDQLCMMSNGYVIRGKNAASGGDGLRECIDSQVPQLAGKYADEIWVLIGANDYWRTLAECETLLVELRSAIIAQNKPKKIRWFGQSPRSVTDYRLTRAYSYNEMLRLFAIRNGDSYHYGWQDIVDPVTGGLLASRSIGDGLHASSYGHNLCAKRIMKQLDIDAENVFFPIGGRGTNPSNYAIASTLSMMDDVNLDGRPDVITLLSGGGGGSSTWSIANMVGPFIGNVFTRSFIGATTYQYDYVEGLPVPEDFCEVMFYCGKKDESKSGITLDVRVDCISATSTVLSSIDYTYGVSALDSIFDLYGFYRFRVYRSDVHADSASLRLSISTRCVEYPHTSKRMFGMVQAIY